MGLRSTQEVQDKFTLAMVALHLKMRDIFTSKDQQERERRIQDFKESYSIVEQGLEALNEILPQ